MSRSVPADNGQAWKVTAEVQANEDLKKLKLPGVDPRLQGGKAAKSWTKRFSN